MQFAEKFSRRISPGRTIVIDAHALEARSRNAARFGAGQLPDDPIPSLNKSIRGFVNIRSFSHYFQNFGEKPLARIFPPVGWNKIFGTTFANFIDQIGLSLRSM